MTPQIRVIVADDDEFDRYVARRVLTKDGRIGHIAECSEGADLVSMLQSPICDGQWGPHPVLVLLDINMPGMSGFDVLRQVSPPPDDDIETNGGADPSAPVSSTCVVLMLTSSVSPRDRQAAAGFPLVVGYMEKPIDSAKLAKVLAEIYPAVVDPNTTS